MLDDTGMADDTTNPNPNVNENDGKAPNPGDGGTPSTPPEGTPQTPPTPPDPPAPAKEPEKVMCSLQNDNGQVIARCPKPKLEASAQSVELAQEELRKLAKEKGVETELGWKWV